MVMKRGRYGLKVVDWLLLWCLDVLATSFLLFVSNKEGENDDTSLKDEAPGKEGNKISSPNLGSSSMFTVHEISQFNNGWTDEKNERFLNYIRFRWLVAPSHGELNISLNGREDFSQFGQSAYVDKILHHKQNGFFVEAGAADGKTHSNTLYLELKRSWTGLLVEPNPEYFQNLLDGKRNSYVINTCLSSSKRSETVPFKALGLFGGVVGRIDDTQLKFVKKLPHYKTKDITAQCFTLHSILLALGQTHVDYFSLDVEGPELDILQTIPFDKLKIDVISVEYRISDNVQANEIETQKKLDNIRDFFENIGNYAEVAILPWGAPGNKDMLEEKGVDIIFKRIH